MSTIPTSIVVSPSYSDSRTAACNKRKSDPSFMYQERDIYKQCIMLRRRFEVKLLYPWIILLATLSLYSHCYKRIVVIYKLITTGIFAYVTDRQRSNRDGRGTPKPANRVDNIYVLQCIYSIAQDNVSVSYIVEMQRNRHVPHTIREPGAA
jgi:hypothetical protein